MYIHTSDSEEDLRLATMSYKRSRSRLVNSDPCSKVDTCEFKFGCVNTHRGKSLVEKIWRRSEVVLDTPLIVGMVACGAGESGTIPGSESVTRTILWHAELMATECDQFV
jgi:hypothetical protein